MLPARSTVILACLLFVLPGSAAIGNEATVVHASEGNATAICQVAVIVGAVIIMGLEDGLGLVEPVRGTPADVVALIAPAGGGAAATCLSRIGELRVDVEGAGPAPVYVGGAAPAGSPPGAATAGGGIAVCQRVVIVSSVILGGTAYGLPAGYHPGALSIESASGDGAGAACEAGVGRVVFD